MCVYMCVYNISNISMHLYVYTPLPLVVSLLFYMGINDLQIGLAYQQFYLSFKVMVSSITTLRCFQVLLSFASDTLGLVVRTTG